jgi:hypothetical protein
MKTLYANIEKYRVAENKDSSFYSDDICKKCAIKLSKDKYVEFDTYAQKYSNEFSFECSECCDFIEEFTETQEIECIENVIY